MKRFNIPDSYIPPIVVASLTVLLCAVYIFASKGLTPPSAKPLDTSSSEFSAFRAKFELQYLLGKMIPHPTGSNANRQIRKRLSKQLQSLGIYNELQVTTKCHKIHPSCVRVENVLARIPGKHQSAILLMAHYDSVPASPGVGDNGAGVATLMEIARAIKQSEKHNNTIIFAFTDAEEIGHLGANAFFTEHPWAENVKAVINIDGGGLAGAAYVLRIAPKSGHILTAFLNSSTRPIANSVRHEIIERKRVGSDFAEAIRANKSGIDFSFTGKRLYNHTAMDTFDNFDIRTLQHHGDNVLPLLKKLANSNLDKISKNKIYMTLHHNWWLAWDVKTIRYISIALVFVLLIVSRIILKKRFYLELARCVLIDIVAVLAIVIMSYSAIWIIDSLLGMHVSWPANPWPWLFFIIFFPYIVSIFLAYLLSNQLKFWPSFLSGLLLWSIISVFMAFLIPRASLLTLIPSLLSICAMLIVVLSPKHNSQPIQLLLSIGCALFASYVVFQFFYSRYIVSGLNSVTIQIISIALLAPLILPILNINKLYFRKKSTISIGLFGIIATTLSIIMSATLPLYSRENPQHINIQLFQHHKSKEGYYQLQSPTPLPVGLVSNLQSVKRTTLLAPWLSKKTSYPSIKMPMIETAIITEKKSVTNNNGRHIAFKLLPSRDVEAISIFIPKYAKVSNLIVAGKRCVLRTIGNNKYYRINFISPPKGGVPVKFTSTSIAPIHAYVADTTYTLHKSAKTISALRSKYGIQYYSGDQWIVYKNIEL